MRPELQAVLRSIEELTPEQLPELLGELEMIRGHCLLKLSRTDRNGARPRDQRIGAKEARSGVSVDYLYRHHHQFPFAARAGRKLLFSANGIDEYIARTR